MEVLDRFLVNKDWITLLLLGVVFLLVIANLINPKRLRQLFALPYSNFYLLNFGPPIWHPFNSIFFVISNIVLSLFIYIIIEGFYPNKITFNSFMFYKILGVVLGYWLFKYLIGKLIAYLFEIEKPYENLLFAKISYFFSITIYLLIFLTFSVYFFDNNTSSLYAIIVLYCILLLVRYFHFLRLYKRGISLNLFYFILYLCALEIAPLFIAIKFGF